MAEGVKRELGIVRVEVDRMGDGGARFPALCRWGLTAWRR